MAEHLPSKRLSRQSATDIINIAETLKDHCTIQGVISN